ncbi:hypothetical protein [Streptomyces bottropensis]|uniref:hypothetical protein n=1 Tax=Streptomyces bottropensis TaxID=42235 RepID=UPI0036B89397
MARRIDDDAPRRKRDAGERIYVVTTNLVVVARHRRLDRIWRAGWAVSWLSLLTAVIGTGVAVLTTGDPARFVLGDLICGSLLLMSLLALVGVRLAWASRRHGRGSDNPSRTIHPHRPLPMPNTTANWPCRRRP